MSLADFLSARYERARVATGSNVMRDVRFLDQAPSGLNHWLPTVVMIR